MSEPTGAPIVLGYATPMSDGDRAGIVVWIATVLVWLVSFGGGSVGIISTATGVSTGRFDYVLIGLALGGSAIIESFAAWQSIRHRSFAWTIVVAASSCLIAAFYMLAGIVIAATESAVVLLVIPIYLVPPTFVATAYFYWAVRLRRTALAGRD